MEISLNNKMLVYKVVTHFFSNHFTICSKLAMKLVWKYSQKYILPIIVFPSYIIGKRILL